MGDFDTQLPTMQQAAAHVSVVNQQIQTQLSTLMHQLVPLTSAWKGQAATTFQQLMTQWHNDATTLNGVLQSISEGLAQSHQTYHAQEETVTQHVSSVYTNLENQSHPST